MDNQQKEAVMGFWMLCAVAVLCWAAVRGCDRMYDPQTLKADADARVELSKIPYTPASSVPK